MNEKFLHKLNKITDKKPRILGSATFSTFSIFIPLIKISEDIHVIFETRAKQLRRQPGEICFPGGRIDEDDKNSEAAAIRETCEELRVTKDDISLIGPLDYLVTPYETIIYPYFGWIDKDLAEISPNPHEVGEIFTVPLTYLIQSEPSIYNVSFQVQPDPDFPLHLIPGGENYNWRVRNKKEYFYFYKDKVIWGMTARILNEFLENFK